MPDKNNRNSREDKSFKHNRFEGRSKKELPEKSNNGKNKLFGDGSESPFKSRSGKPAGRKRTESNSGNDRPYDRKPFDKKERGFDKKSNRPGSDRKTFGEKRSDTPRERNSFGSENERFGAAKSFERKRPGAGGTKNFGKASERRSSDRRQEGDWIEKRTGQRKERRRISGENPQRIEQTEKRTPKTDDLIRLNRYIANAGICSRRKADELIEAGVISVNGEVVSELGFKVNPGKDVIRYNNEVLKREKMVYVLLNKPKDYITTTEDPQERRTVMHLVEKASRERIYPVGRLDRNTTGLLLMTNDGDLAEKLSHPRNNVTKIYQVELNKSLSQGDFNKIEYGLELEDGLIKPDSLSYVQGGSKREIGIQIHSGKNRIVRRIFEHLGYEVVKLDRVVYANLTKKDLPRGRWRYLEEKEIIQLKHFIK